MLSYLPREKIIEKLNDVETWLMENGYPDDLVSKVEDIISELV